mmetsp:Transcript_82387/g.129641  ORF Transcript_82387/g.129641 Transcript_82387/m.129641 type:complete len:728 (-) Transcript_82387:84-2267(-)|eukprot:CAMPEP_0169104264 /NCGR_PEP_ID=MMETSP1015-20121227/23162_1 /TAXON_ID=342587 /ORGANISM="Karlodinium micrum, Strain CCMP2283" /LENGTH=727 /DNA_ID=CAMNT_0009165529 /DNA_START=60 /DNA_END=2243 /DNA_ORIENTATION=-
MKAALPLVVTLLFINAPGLHAATVALSPVTRVVELLQNLAKQVEAEGKKEEDLYENFVCWGQSVINQKTASNAAAEARINELETYIADLAAGRIELTSERADLEKEIAGLLSDLENAAAIRKKEHKDFLDAEDEMTKAITALQEAIDTLDEATKDHKEGVLLAVRSRLRGASEIGGMEALVERQASLKHAVDLGERFLAKADATFLKRVLLGDVPTVDWKKLNRKATFKMSYKARSFKIQEVLKKMHQTFTLNLKDATEKENAAKAEYDKLKASKEDQLGTSRDALTKMEVENGAKGMSSEQAQEEVDALKTQVKDDTKFIAETQQSVADKKEAWKVRSELRAGELAAINKAIYILHNDDARDLFKKSFGSQGFFLQMAQSATKAQTHRAQTAASAIREAAKRSGDQRLLSLAAALSHASPDSVKVKFEPIIKSIDKMIALLQEEENKDLEIKEKCEEDRMSDTRAAISASREIDEATDLVNKLTAKIEECQKKIEELVAAHKEAEEALAKATNMRNDEHAAWLITDKDDKEAAETVASAKEVLEGFYKDNFALVQKQPVTGMKAGEAPPPPPPTWEGGYGGKQGESQGIVAIMEMVHEDIVKDRADAKADEDKSQAEYDAFKQDTEDHMKALMSQKDATESEMGDAETKRTETKEMRTTKKGELDAILKKISDINPNCEYFEVNYVMRRNNRQIELDGLQKAKAILEGGVFDEAPDPNREIKPGDA